MLPRMDHAAFLTEAWNTIARALAEAGVDAGLHKHPELIRKSVKRRCTAELKRLAVLIRRLIFLMAMGLELSPLVPRAGKNYFETDKAPGPKRYAFQLTPTLAGECPDFLHGPVSVPVRGPVPAAALTARWWAMLDALKYHKRRAKCLARTIQRWRERREAKPYILPIPKTHRMPAALGLVSGGLVARLNESLQGWDDTG